MISTDSTEGMGPLSNIRVADFTWVGAGPFLTKPLADHGADVIKIESRTRTDPIRWMEPFRDGVRGVNRSAYFANRNSSKRSICLDIKHPVGHELALKLIERSDVVANNFSAGTMDRLGLGYAAARTARPDIIYLDMPMQGNTGPQRDFRGYGLTIGAISGFLATSGWPDRKPLGTGTNYPDHVPNPLHGVIAVLAALRHRRRTGEGQHIELSQLESTINVIAPAVLEEQLSSGHFERRGNRDMRYAPHGVYRCAGEDRWCAIAIETDNQWISLCSIFPALSLGLGADFEGHLHRIRNSGTIDALLAEAVRGNDVEDLVARLVAAGVPASQVNDASDVLRDPQLVSRRHWVTLNHPEMGPSVYDAPPYRLSRTPGHLRSPAPILGADSEDVAMELMDLSRARFIELRDEGIIG